MSREIFESDILVSGVSDPVEGLKMIIIGALMMLPREDREELLRPYTHDKE